ncbi:MAG: bifunctional shikimate kinase/3-dehydroquinate synthase [Actinobacteria bacterium]|nr:MAG: bifunctional shikimate kinase/3-dehydroquinate synthase [Actinomycetota bacterium]
MGAGKSTLGQEVAARLHRPFVDVDARIESREGSIPELFERGIFREVEERVVLEALMMPPGVIALGGGAVEIPAIREALRAQATTVLVEIELETAWQRVRGSDRPLAQDEADFRELYARRQPLYDEVADGRARDADGVVLAAGGVTVAAMPTDLVPGPGPAELVADERVLELHRPPVEARVLTVPAGEEAKTVATAERLWRGLQLDRGGTLVAFGGGCTTDVAGFVAATYLRGIDWIAVPTTLVGQVDAAIGGKTAINLPEGKNLVGAFHWPVRTVIDPTLLRTLPEEQRREGLAEVVKTGLLAGEPLWELPDADLVRRCAAFKAALCLRDPYDRGPRQALNLGHTFAHALEAAAGYETVTHGRAVGLGLLAALRLSGRSTEAVEEVLAPEPVNVGRERAWEALKRDKKSTGDELTLVLLGDDGGFTANVAETDVRGALDELIAD